MKPPKVSLEVVQALKDSVLYSSDIIMHFAHARGMFPQDVQECTAARHALHQLLEQLVREKGFPTEGDGAVPGSRRQAEPGWYGRRWKAALSD